MRRPCIPDPSPLRTLSFSSPMPGNAPLMHSPHLFDRSPSHAALMSHRSLRPSSDPTPTPFPSQATGFHLTMPPHWKAVICAIRLFPMRYSCLPDSPPPLRPPHPFPLEPRVSTCQCLLLIFFLLDAPTFFLVVKIRRL